MKLACRHEPDVARALREGRRPSAPGAHVETCPKCREAARLADRLQAMARRSEAVARPPDPGDLWNRAALMREVARRRDLTRRAARPAVWFQRVAAILAAAATAAWITTAWENLGAAAAALAGVDPRALLAGDWLRVLGDLSPLAVLVGALLFGVYLWGWSALGRLARP